MTQDRLTESQKQKIPEYVRRWFDCATSAKPTIARDAELAVLDAYEAAGLRGPEIAWCRSPWEAACLRAERLTANQLIGENVQKDIFDNVLRRCESTLMLCELGQRDLATGGLRSLAVKDGVISRLREMAISLPKNDFSNVVFNAHLDIDPGSQIPERFVGCDFFLETFATNGAVGRARGIVNLAKHAGWILAHATVCWVSDRPTVINLNAESRPHCEDGPAIAYSDGFKIWYINGALADEQIVLKPETQTIEQIDSERNQEKKRIRIERFGWPRYIAETDAECLDSRRNDVDGTREALVRLKDGSIRMLCACRSTGRTYAVGVAREIKTCEEAQDWMMGGSALRPVRVRRNIIVAS